MSKRSGYTIIEVIIVIVIITMLALLGLPAFTKYRQVSEFTQKTEEVKELFNSVRAKSLSPENSKVLEYRVRPNGATKYELISCSGAPCSSSSPTPTITVVSEVSLSTSQYTQNNASHITCSTTIDDGKAKDCVFSGPISFGDNAVGRRAEFKFSTLNPFEITVETNQL